MGTNLIVYLRYGFLPVYVQSQKKIFSKKYRLH